MAKIVNTERVCYASPRDSAGHPHAELLAVLTQDESGLYAVYVGLVESPERGISQKDKEGLHQLNAEWVTGHGSKMSFAKSQNFFRGIKEEEYRA